MLDWANLSLEHVVFSLNPGVWEEFFFRGIIMTALLQRGMTLRRAALIQVILFGLTHIKEFALWDWVDVLSVMILGAAFLYTAHKTRTLVASIAFHTLHDAFLFLVLVPGGDYAGVLENLALFAALWPMVGVVWLLTKLAADRLGVRAEAELYEVARPAVERA